MISGLEADVFPDSLEETEKFIEDAEDLLQELDSQRGNILTKLQKGKDLMRDQSVLSFVPGEVKTLEETWNNAYKATTDRLNKLKGKDSEEPIKRRIFP